MSDTAGNKDASIEELAANARERIIEHFKGIGLDAISHSTNGHLTLPKEKIRQLHAEQRKARAFQEMSFVMRHGPQLIPWFASGTEIEVEKISPELILVESGTFAGNLFRFATLLWSIPVSRGFGRRMRYVILDRNNQKLIGLFALGDPVFNLHVRDQWIGWNVRDREKRLVNVLDAYVLGAVPPYAQLLGGKLVGSLVGSTEVSDFFEQKYGEKKGIISGEYKSPRLALVTTTSALGRSSIYNRLKVPNVVEYYKLGVTSGYGHFHIPDDIFEDLRHILELEDHKYASGHRYGDGPNWKFRVVRVGLKRIGLDPDMLRHGVQREVYGIPLADNWREYLKGEVDTLISQRPPAADINAYCLERWIVPRSIRKPDYLAWTREMTWKQVFDNCGFDAPLSLQNGFL